MSDDAKLCRNQETCPLLIEALKQKGAAESQMRLAISAQKNAETAFEIKRHLFNEFYKLVVDCRKAQTRYFTERTQAALIASKQAERKLDAHVEMLRKSSSRNVIVQPALIEV